MIYLFILQTSRYIVVRRAIIDISNAKGFFTPQTSRYIVVERGIIDNFICKRIIGIVGGLALMADTAGRLAWPARWAGLHGRHGGLPAW